MSLLEEWAKNNVTRKCFNAGKISLTQFNQLQENFLADIEAEVKINNLLSDLIFNWIPTALHQQVSELCIVLREDHSYCQM